MYWFAEITLESASAGQISLMLSDILLPIPEPLVFASRGESVVCVGHRNWHDASTEDKLMSVSLAIAAATALDDDDPATLTFTFSNCATDTADAKDLLEQWVATGEPPVMSIISFRLCEDGARHVSFGLSALTGFELSVEYASADFERDALRDLLRLTRHCLMQGNVRVGQVFRGVGHDVTLVGFDDTRPLVDYWFSLRAPDAIHRPEKEPRTLPPNRSTLNEPTAGVRRLRRGLERPHCSRKLSLIRLLRTY